MLRFACALAFAASATVISLEEAFAGKVNPASPPMAARDAGARYGQALGSLEICFGAKITDKAKALSNTYQGAEQDVFKAQAAKVFEAWNEVKNCKNQSDPNQCKIIMDKSCASAEVEIGATGTVLPGLVEFLKR